MSDEYSIASNFQCDRFSEQGYRREMLRLEDSTTMPLIVHSFEAELTVHTCRQTEDPRKPGRCACGKPVEIPPEPLQRILELEREITFEAAKGATDPQALIDHGEIRAANPLCSEYVGDAMLVKADRDLAREAREELVDCRNYIVWLIQHRFEDDDRRHDWMIALRHVCIAYDVLLGDA